jgi:hypothetical protein
MNYLSIPSRIMMWSILIALAGWSCMAQDGIQQNTTGAIPALGIVEGASARAGIASLRIGLGANDVALNSLPALQHILEKLQAWNGCLGPHQVLILHFIDWSALTPNGPFELKRNHNTWDAFSGMNEAGGCHLRRLPKSGGVSTEGATPQGTDDQFVLRGYREALLLGINSFDNTPGFRSAFAPGPPTTPPTLPESLNSALVGVNPPGPQPVSAVITYKVSATQVTSEFIQDLSMVISAALGLTLPTGGGAPTLTAPPPSSLYVAFGRIAGLRKLPFDFNIGYNLATQTSSTGGGSLLGGGAPGGGPPVMLLPMPVANVGSPYRQPLPYPAGLPPGAYSFALLAGNQPPAGLTVSADGILSGTPTTAATAPFHVSITVNTVPPTSVLGHYQISVLPAGVSPALLGGAAPAGGPNQGNTPSNPSSNASSSANVVDCTSVTDKSPCSFNISFRTIGRQWADFSIAVTTPGIREAKFASAGAPASLTRHTELYGMLDIYPFAPLGTKASAYPHLNVGLPFTGKPFYMPYFGVGENVTGWYLEKHGFPLRINVFWGVIYSKESFNLSPNASTPVFKPGRELKAVWGVEVPLSTLISKVSGVASKSGASGSSSGGGGKQH